MPELPEVETIRGGLEKYLAGHRIEDVEVRDKRKVFGDMENVKGAKFTKVRRFGKGLVMDLNNGYSIAVHIKLTGQFIYRGKETTKIVPSEEFVGDLPSHVTRIIYKLDGGATLYFNDLRKFGWTRILKTNEVKNLPFFKGLGPEPFKDLTFDYFEKVIKSSRGPVKPALMDQEKMSGIGNIYANEGLFLAGIDPTRKGSSLNDKEIKKVYDSVLEALKRGFKYDGASELKYVNALGQRGKYQEHFLVYSRDGEKCLNKCGGTIKKIFIGGRGTYFCPNCQQ